MQCINYSAKRPFCKIVRKAQKCKEKQWLPWDNGGILLRWEEGVEVKTNKTLAQKLCLLGLESLLSYTAALLATLCFLCCCPGAAWGEGGSRAGADTGMHPPGIPVRAVSGGRQRGADQLGGL